MLRNDGKREVKWSLALAVLFVATVSLLVVPNTTKVALASNPTDPEKVIDPGLGCGPEYWGVKTSPHMSNEWVFGKTEDCTNAAGSIGGRTNYVEINTELFGNMDEEFAIDWMGVIQGKDPWGNDGSFGGGADPNLDNVAFPALATNDYTLKAQWRWTDDLDPLTDDITANYLTDLWLKSGNVYMVIDFMWMQLESTGNNGEWQQHIVSDSSTGVNGAPGTQYYEPFCQLEGGPGGVGTVYSYHYNVVLDNTSHGMDQWIEKIANINSYLTDAVDYDHYKLRTNDLGTCPEPSPGIEWGLVRQDYTITGIETGIEVSAQDFGKAGAAKGYFSNSNLYYAGMELRGKQLGTVEDRIEGLSVAVFNPSGTQVASGYLPLFYKPTTTGTYTVKFNNYGEYYFTRAPISGAITDYHVYTWGGEVKVSVTSTSNGIGVDSIYYKNSDPEGHSKVEFRANSPSLHMLVTIKDASGNTLSRGYTPFTIGIPEDQNTTVIWTNYGTHNITGRQTNTSEQSWVIAPPPSWGATQVIVANNPGGGSNYYSQGNYT